MPVCPNCDDANVVETEIPSTSGLTNVVVLECNECGWTSLDDSEEDDVYSADEGRILAGMEGGNRGLAEYDGLDLDYDPSEHPGYYDED